MHRRPAIRRAFRLTLAATDDLERIRFWYSQSGAGTAARQRMEAIVAAIRGLRRTPCQYPRGEHRGTRQMIVEGHTVVYEVNPDTGENATAGDVLVLRVFGPGQSRDPL